MVHDTLVGSDDHDSELSGWEDEWDELLILVMGDVESWGDDSTFVESSVQLNHDLS